MTSNTLYGIGISMGMEAAKRNAPCVPANDQKFMDYVKKNCKEVGSAIPISKGWLAGYRFQVDLHVKELRLI